MRWIVVSLLLINIALAGWYIAQSPVTEGPANDGSQPAVKLNNLTLESAKEEPLFSRVGGQETPEPLVAQCAFLGRFTSDAAAQDAQGRLQVLEVDSTVEVVEVPDEPLWWVHIAPANTRTDAERRLRTLNERQIESFLVTQGEFRNAISLGYFRSRDNAMRLRSNMESEGIEVSLREMQRFRQEYWLVVPPNQANLLSDNSVRPIRDQVPDVALQREACDWLQNS